LAAPPNPALRGIALILVAVAIFAAMDTTAKYLSKFYPVPGIVWMRYAVNLVVLVALLGVRGQLRYMRTSRPAIQLLRGLLLGLATMLFFFAISVMPLAEAAAVGFVMPLVVAILAVPLLKERMDMPRLLAALVGLAGALIIVRPGSAVFTPFALLPLLMAVFNALYHILTRKVAGLEPPLTSLFYGALVGAVMFAPAVPFAFELPQGALHWSLFLMLGVLASIGHFILIRAYELAPATLLAPFHYSVLVWVLLSGYLLFGDFPDGWSIAGMVIIVMSGLYLANRQRYVVHK
jgi:drug/metabolite transporter (DMT)-like permease